MQKVRTIAIASAALILAVASGCSPDTASWTPATPRSVGPSGTGTPSAPASADPSPAGPGLAGQAHRAAVPRATSTPAGGSGRDATTDGAPGRPDPVRTDDPADPGDPAGDRPHGGHPGGGGSRGDTWGDGTWGGGPWGDGPWGGGTWGRPWGGRPWGGGHWGRGDDPDDPWSPGHQDPGVPDESVIPGAPCADAGALGETDANDLMRCAATPDDPELRWRPA